MIGVRKLLDFVFSKEELRILDDILPEFKRKQKLDEKAAKEKEVFYIIKQLIVRNNKSLTSIL